VSHHLTLCYLIFWKHQSFEILMCWPSSLDLQNDLFFSFFSTSVVCNVRSYFCMKPQFIAGNKSLIRRFTSHVSKKELLNKLKTKVLSEVRNKRNTSLKISTSCYSKALSNDTRNSTFAEQMCLRSNTELL